jgi:hypothetical protein
MRSHLLSLGIGGGMVVVGVLLWTLTRGLHPPVIAPAKVGAVLVALGVLELAVTAVALALPSSRHRDYGL